MSTIIHSDKVHPIDGGCWFCHIKDDNLVFDTEFDTYVHINCIKKELESGHESEAIFMTYLLIDE